MTFHGEPLIRVGHELDSPTVTPAGTRRKVLGGATQRESEQHHSDEGQECALPHLVRTIENRDRLTERGKRRSAIGTEPIDVDAIDPHLSKLPIHLVVVIVDE